MAKEHTPLPESKGNHAGAVVAKGVLGTCTEASTGDRTPRRESASPGSSAKALAHGGCSAALAADATAAAGSPPEEPQPELAASQNHVVQQAAYVSPAPPGQRPSQPQPSPCPARQHTMSPEPQTSISPLRSSVAACPARRCSARLKRKGSPSDAPQIGGDAADPLQHPSSPKLVKTPATTAAGSHEPSRAGKGFQRGEQADGGSPQGKEGLSDDSDADLLSPGLLKMVCMRSPRTRAAAAKRAVQDSLALMEMQDKVTATPLS